MGNSHVSENTTLWYLLRATAVTPISHLHEKYAKRLVSKGAKGDALDGGFLEIARDWGIVSPFAKTAEAIDVKGQDACSSA